MIDTKTCAWCDGKGTTKYHEPGEVCGWCDGTGIQKPNFDGGGGPGEHRSCGPIRAWCHDCREWCYNDPEARCGCCGGVHGNSTDTQTEAK